MCITQHGIAQAFLPQRLNVETAHTAVPLQQSWEHSEQRPRKKAKRAADGEEGVSFVVPDMVRVIEEIKGLGAGLVADVRLRHAAEP